MRMEDLIYQHNSQELHGYLVWEEHPKPKPAVIIIHDWSGLNEFARLKAEAIAKLGYLGFAVDMYGKGKTGSTVEEKQALIKPFMEDREHLAGRIKAAYDEIKTLPEVDKNRIALMGFCFGGLCALDLARSGAEIKGAISFHGLLMKPQPYKLKPIKAKILVLHGYDDPMAKPEAVQEFCQEMTEAKADWQVHMYGGVQHGFTNPEAHDAASGIYYNKLAEQRSLKTMENFLEELFK